MKTKVIIRKNLHAKILLVDRKQSLISFMNITERSTKDNIEFGVYTENPGIIQSIILFVKEVAEDEEELPGKYKKH